MKKILLEGGNVFKDANKQPLTIRINKADIKPSLKFVEKILGMKLDVYLGTTGKKESSGDIDVSVDESKYDKKEIATKLKEWAKSKGLKPGEWVKLTGTNVHFKLPIGNSGDFVQLDLMFGNPKFQTWSMRGETGKFTGMHRHILMASIAKAQNLKWSYLHGLTKRDAAKGEAGIKDPVKIIKTLLPGYVGNPANFGVESILEFIFKKYKGNVNAIDALIGEAATTLEQHYNVTLPSPYDAPVNETDVYFLARLRDSILTSGSGMILEAKLRAMNHIEDLVLDEGTAGLIRAIKILRSFAEGSAHSDTTIKWDGSPNVIFGRNEAGEFMLTDKSGFSAKGYDGKVTSKKALGQMFATRKAPMDDNRKRFVKSMMGIWDIYEKATPENFRGYVSGDLMYYTTPPLKNGTFEFKPNVVQYNVKKDSKFGQAIGKSKSGIVLHNYMGEQFSNIEDAIGFLNTGTVFIIPPVYVQSKSSINTKPIDKLESYANKNMKFIEALFNPDGLKGIANIHQLFYKYINSKVKIANGLENLGDDFADWLNTEKLTDKKRTNIATYLNENVKGVSALWVMIRGIMKLKDFLVTEFDNQASDVIQSINGESGGEGYVVKDSQGLVKLVSRGKFSAANFAAHG